MCLFRFKAKITEPSQAYTQWLAQQRTVKDIINFANNFTYVSDKEQFGKVDRWQTPSEFFVNKRGDCFTGDTKIIVVNKETKYYELKSLKELEFSWQKYQALSYNFKTQQYEFKNITAFMNKGEKPVKKYWLKNNTYFKCTDNHRFFTANALHNVTQYDILNKNGSIKIKEIEAKNLSTDWRKPEHFIFMANSIPALNAYKEDKEIAWLKGLYTAEGYSEKYHVCIANDNLLIRKKVESILTKHNIPYSNSKRLKCGYQSILKSSLKQELQEFGHNAFDKDIPSAYLSMGEEEIEFLLDGNADGDGYRLKEKYNDGKKLVYSTSSDSLCEKIFFLHLILNRPLTIYHSIKHGGVGKKPIWRLYENINNRQKREYLNGIGKIGVKRIEDVGIEEVYDITVEDNHNFILWNGVIAHNCEDIHLFIADAIHRALGLESYLIIAWKFTRFPLTEAHGMTIYKQSGQYYLLNYRRTYLMNSLKDKQALKQAGYNYIGGIWRMPDGRRV